MRNIIKFAVIAVTILLLIGCEEEQEQLLNPFVVSEISGTSTTLEIDSAKSSEIIRTKPQVIKVLDRTLTRVPIDFETFTDEGQIEVDLGVTYQDSVTSITMYENDIIGRIDTLDLYTVRGTVNLIAVSDTQTFTCFTTYDIQDIAEFQSAASNDIFGQANKKVRVYFELENDVVKARGSAAAAVQYLNGVFNVVKLLYNNDGVQIEISEVFAWTNQDPYPNTSTTEALVKFRNTRTSYNGDLAHLVSIPSQPSGGIAYVNALCSQYGYAYSHITNSYSQYPAYSWTVNVLTHEIGHNLGSPHTHDCSWPGGAIDNCYQTSGGCPAGPAPTNGGTIMSYCHLRSYGINPKNGFGPLPKNLILTRINAATCLQPSDPNAPTCTDGVKNGNETGVDCGGNCPPCPEPGYCKITSKVSKYEWITGVKIGGTEYKSNASLYSDFTGKKFVVAAGSSVALTLSPNAPTYPEGWQVWIDYNKNQKFDGTEKVYGKVVKGVASGTIAIPQNVTGETTMRVKLEWGKVDNNPCGTYNYGETEDYTIQFSDGEPCPNPSASGTVQGNKLSVTVSSDVTYVNFTVGTKVTKDSAKPFEIALPNSLTTVSAEAYNNCGNSASAGSFKSSVCW